MFADWSDRIAAGAVPEAPPRPQGVERNVVITMWGWGDNVAFVHDEVATDKRNPRVNASGPVYGVDIGNDFLLVTDPNVHSSVMLKIPTRADPSTVPSLFAQEGFQPYRYFGSDVIWTDPANPHNPMLDGQGRVWMTTRLRGIDNPAWCQDGSDHPSAQYFPLQRSFRQAGYYDPETETFVLIDTCFSTHHLQFAEDAHDTLYFSAAAGAEVGWINTEMYDETGDERLSQGWCPQVIDTNGDGRITKPWNEPPRRGDTTEPGFDPTLDTRVAVYSYGVIPSPVDASVWVVSDDFPGRLLRLDPGDNPPESCISELYVVPVDRGYRSRGLDIDRNGVVWTALAGSSHFASFDRRKCTVFGGPGIREGRQCDEGWTFYPMPGPSYQNTDIGADFHYYNWVDQFNTLGLGENVPIANGSNSDSLLALDPDTGEWVVLRVPYPQGFHSRGLDGRIDDPNGGWKGSRRLRDVRCRRGLARRRWPRRNRESRPVPDPSRSPGELIVGGDTSCDVTTAARRGSLDRRLHPDPAGCTAGDDRRRVARPRRRYRVYPIRAARSDQRRQRQRPAGSLATTRRRCVTPRPVPGLAVLQQPPLDTAHGRRHAVRL